MDTIAVFGIYPTYQSVENAVQLLKRAGIRDTDVSLLLPENLGPAEPAATTVTAKKATKQMAGIGAGAASEDGPVSAGLTWLSGLDVLALPGLGPLLVAGPVGGALAGVDGTAGTIARALADFGVPHADAEHYERYLQEGGILLSIHGDDMHAAHARQVLLEQSGAIHIAIGHTAGDRTNTSEARL